MTSRKIAEICQPPVLVRKALGEYWDSDHVHFLITAVESQGDEDLTTAAERRDIVPGLPLQILNRRKYRVSIPYFHIAQNLPRPRGSQRSYAASSLNGCPVQRIRLVAGQIEDCHIQRVFRVRPGRTTKDYYHHAAHPNLPPRFPEFLDRVNDPEFKPDEVVVAHVLRLMTHSSQIHPYEDGALVQLRLILTDLLEGYMSQAISEKKCTPDGVVLKRAQMCEIPLILFEYKRSIGEGGCDPSVQAACSLRRFLYKTEVRAFHVFCIPPVEFLTQSSAQ